MKYIKLFEEFKKNFDNLTYQLIMIQNGWDLDCFLNKNGFKPNYDLNSTKGIEDWEDDIEIIGAGSYGITYEFGGFVYKLTFDKSTYFMCRKLIGKKFIHLVDILDIEVMHNNSRSLYLIKMNKCEAIKYDFLREFIETVNLITFLNICERPDVLTKFISDYYIMGQPEGIAESMIEYLHNEIHIEKQFVELKKELKICGLDKYKLDLNPNNIMLKNGKICLIDFVHPDRNNY